MARSEIRTLIPLDRAATILGIDPFHFNRITTALHPEAAECDDVWYQSPYMDVGRVSLDDLAFSLAQAEELASTYLGFFPVPTWVSSEERIVDKPYAVELQNVTGLNSRGQPKSVRSRYGYVISGGVRGSTLIEADSAISYSDEDNDGYEETGTLSVATTVTDEQEIHLFFPGKSGSLLWEIRPISVSISGGIATITFKKYLAPLPELWETGPTTDDPGMWRSINGDSDSNFLTIADVYRVYNDPSQQATFYNESTCDSCMGSGCPQCGWATVTGCIRRRDARLGILSYSPATWDEDEEEFVSAELCCGDPDKIYISYYSGWQGRDLARPLIDMDAIWERALVNYAFANLDREIRCTNTHNLWAYLAEDMALVQSDRSHLISTKDLSNPLGTSRAGIQLWRLIERYQIGI